MSGTDQQPSVPMVVTILVLLCAGIIYVFGYARAVMHRASGDLKKNKADRWPLRWGFWGAWWRAVKVGFWVCLGAFVLVVWAVRDVHNSEPKPASTAPAVVSSKGPK